MGDTCRCGPACVIAVPGDAARFHQLRSAAMGASCCLGCVACCHELWLWAAMTLAFSLHHCCHCFVCHITVVLQVCSPKRPLQQSKRSICRPGIQHALTRCGSELSHTSPTLPAIPAFSVAHSLPTIIMLTLAISATQAVGYFFPGFLYMLSWAARDHPGNRVNTQLWKDERCGVYHHDCVPCGSAIQGLSNLKPLMGLWLLAVHSVNYLNAAEMYRILCF